MNMQQAHAEVIAARNALEAAKAAYEAACEKLAEFCPHQPGTVATLSYYGGEASPVYVERVRISVSDAGTHWVMTGRKVKANGQPHATALALGNMLVGGEQ